ncbi:MAG: hypothetical protein ABI035_15025 [Gemmatimonadaceae bacterium]
MARGFRYLVGVSVAFVAWSGSPAHAQTSLPVKRVAATRDSSATTVLARAAIEKFFPSVLSDTADPGTLFVVVGADGKLIDATHGGREDNDKLRAKYEEFDSKVESLEIKTVPAGALLPRALQVVITHFKM